MASRRHGRTQVEDSPWRNEKKGDFSSSLKGNHFEAAPCGKQGHGNVVVAVNKRPKSVTVIGWIFIVVGIIALVLRGEELIFFGLIPFMWRVRLFLEVALAVVALLGGIYFLKLRAWARTVLEVACWVFVVYGIGFQILGGIHLVGEYSKFADVEGTSGIGATQVLGIAAWLALCAAIGLAPAIVIIAFLRGKTIREAVRPKMPVDSANDVTPSEDPGVS